MCVNLGLYIFLTTDEIMPIGVTIFPPKDTDYLIKTAVPHIGNLSLQDQETRIVQEIPPKNISFAVALGAFQNLM